MTDDKSPSTTRLSPRTYALAARARGTTQRVGPPLLFGGLALSWIAPGVLSDTVLAALVLTGVALLILGIPLVLARLEPSVAPRAIDAPARGRWRVLNSPASAVPSHGSNGYGQTYGFDLIHEPPGGERPGSGRALGFERPERFPAFGEPVLAPAAGVVVSTRATGRDHRARSCWPAYAVLYLEGFVRELLGVRHVVGNSVVIDIGDGAYALCGHLRRGSVAVRPGDRVRAGEQIARCGNSGNSSEPHIHVQVMDHRKPLYAGGLPVVLPAFARPDRPSGIPANDEYLDAGASPAATSAGASHTLRPGVA